MKNGYRVLIRELVAVALVAVLVLPASMGQQSLANGSIIYVDADATGNNNGTSWEDAYTTLQPALVDAVEGEKIWVAAGTYRPTYLFSPGDPRSATFRLKNGVALYGGFDPTVDDVGWEDRDWVGNETILSGDIGTAGDREDNSYHVFYHPSELALDSTAILDGFTITGGNADAYFYHNGGGMSNSGCSPTVSNCTFRDNEAGYAGEIVAGWGGGMYNDYSSPTVTNCTFKYNQGFIGGGMANWHSSSPIVTNCTFTNNGVNIAGKGMDNYSSSPTVTNCTFAGNSDTRGSEMHNWYSSSPTVTNCIFWGGSATQIYNDEGSLPTVTYSDIRGSYPGTGNIDADPRFVSSGDYHLRLTSPCIDAGTNDAPFLPANDVDGDPRVADENGDGMAVVDMGVDENQGIPRYIIYVDQDAAGENDGSSWADAYTELQPALEDATDGDQIWVAAGTYTPTHRFSPDDPRSATFHLKNGVGVYGGFDPSVGDTGWGGRDWAGNETILSGDIGITGDPSDNSYHVFYHSAFSVDASAVLDGFTITGGNANGPGDHTYGGGMANWQVSPSVTNCTFSGNSAETAGGGMSNWHSSSPTVTNCAFSGNSAGGDGGGMSNFYYSSPAVTHCTFSGNSAGGAGGGIFNLIDSSPPVVNCTFLGNSAVYGAGMANYSSSPAVTNCTFSGNLAEYGGGIRNNWASPAVTNCILWGDSVDEISNTGDSQPVITFSDIEGGYDGTGNIDADPQFVYATSDDYHLGPGSPCIDAGTNDVSFLPVIDVDGELRVMDGDHDGPAIVDMGVDEVWRNPPDVIYVDRDAAGHDNGTSWPDALRDVQHALVWAVDGVEIWVAEGVYTPTLEFSPGDPRSATFQLRNGVALYGGFDPSAGDIDWGDRDWVRNLTVLSGERGSPENSDNCYHIFYHPEGTDLNRTSILDGFMLTGGNADADYGPYGVGGGMYNDGSSPMLTNCTFSGNSSGYGGSGIYNHGASPVVTRCTFSDNSTTGCGGGISNDWGSTMSVTDCTFSNNVADMGGGMCNGESSPAVANCAFSGNSARLGAGVYNRESSPAVTNCSLFLNLASGCGGGLFNLASSPALTNCILWGDTPEEIVNAGTGSTPAVSYSDVQGGYDGIGNIDEDPRFVDADGGDYHLRLGSPCIDTGYNDAPDLPNADFEGHSRIVDGDRDGTATVDMGVDEVLLRVYLPLILRGE